jgi:chloramphenicol 3-O phosphotransferase
VSAAAAGRVILLLGTSSAGKSTLARAIQAAAPEHFLLQSLDGLFAGVAERWGSGGEHRDDGFRYQADGEVRRVIYGPAGWRLLQGFHRAVAAYARAGANVLVDDMLLDEACLADWAEALDGLPVTLVRLSASLEELRRREGVRPHGRVPGLSEGHLPVHERLSADLSLDTSAQSPAEMAAAVVEQPPGKALGLYRDAAARST